MTKEDRLTQCLKYAKLRMLSVGSGDGSQQLAIVNEGHTNLCATFYDSINEVLRKYPHSASILKELKQKCRYPPLFQIDATKLHRYIDVLKPPFDLIFFSFPHSGVPNNSKENVSSNQKLLRGFLASAHRILAPGGQIQLTLKTGQHYDRWGLDQIIREESNLEYVGSDTLKKDLFPGYKHRLTNGMGGQLKEVPDNCAIVHRFRRGQSAEGHRQSRTASCLTSIDIFAMENPEIPSSDSENDEGRSDDGVNHKRKSPGEEPAVAFNDASIRERILSFLKEWRNKKKKKTAPTVLEIRRQAFGSSLPPVPQLNRALYQLDKEQVLQKLPCKERSQKPRWAMRGVTDSSFTARNSDT